VSEANKGLLNVEIEDAKGFLTIKVLSRINKISSLCDVKEIVGVTSCVAGVVSPVGEEKQYSDIILKHSR
jgi:hypothetical protein